MPPARAQGPARRSRYESRSVASARRFALLVFVSSILLVTLLLTAFGAGGADAVDEGVAAPPKRLLPAGPPRPEIVALRGGLRLQLPIAQSRVTAIGYHAAGGDVLELEALGRQGNRGLFRRLADRIFGASTAGLVYYDLDGNDAPNSALDAGAAPGTDVFSPVDGTVVGITDFVLSRRSYGVRVDIQPFAAPALVVSVTRLRPDPALTVGSTVTAATSRIGTVLDLSVVEEQALARYTQDAGNHVSVEVRPAGTLSLP